MLPGGDIFSGLVLPDPWVLVLDEDSFGYLRCPSINNSEELVSDSVRKRWKCGHQNSSPAVPDMSAAALLQVSGPENFRSPGNKISSKTTTVASTAGCQWRWALES